MKSAILTLLFLIIIFIALNSGALDIIRSSAFHYMSLGVFVLVFAAAGFLVGFKQNDSESQLVEAPKANDSDLQPLETQEENNNEKQS